MTEEKIDPYNKNRAVTDHEAALRNGFADSRTFYEVGRGVIDIGVENAKRSKHEVDAMSTVVEVCENGRALIESENREYFPDIDATQLIFHPDGTIGQAGKSKRFPLTEHGFSRLCSLITGTGADYLTKCPPDLRATNVNHWLPQALTEKKGDPRKLAFWMRDQAKQSNKREIFSVFGSRYVPFGGDQILRIVQERAPANAKAEMTYDGYKGKIDIIFHSDVKAEDYVVGEYFKAGISMEWADDGTGGITAKSLIWRNLCLNLIRIAKLQKVTGRRRHSGTVDSIEQDVSMAFDAALDSISYFTNKWNEGSKDNILEKYDLTEAQQVFRGLVYNKVVWMPGVKPVEQVERLMTCYEREPGYTKTAFVNAVSRAAHEYSFESPWVQEELEESAGNLLYAKVWNVWVPENEEQGAF